MRARLIITLVLALLLAACGDDGGLFPTSTAEETTTTNGETTTTGDGTTTTGGVTTTGPGGQSGWFRVPHDEAVFGPALEGFYAVMSGVTAGGPGLVAVGSRFVGGDYATAAAVWTSSDGVTWSLLPHDPAVFGGWNMEKMQAVAAGPLGLVAVGAEYPGEDWDAAVWTSPDGLAWSRVSDPGVLGGPGWQRMHAVTAGGPGWVAVGYGDVGEGAEGDWIAAVWTSPDGVTWTRVPHDEALFGGMNDQEMFGVVAAGPGLVAVGNDDEAPAAWVSPDGLSWEKVPSDRFFCDPAFDSADKVMRAVAVGPMGLVAVGRLEWYVDPDTEDDVDAAVWVSVDGLDWTLVSEDVATFGGPGNQEMVAVTAGGPGLVAVGWDYSGGDGNAAVWTSADGTTWSRVADDAVFGGSGDQQMTGVMAAAGGLVAVGLDGPGGSDADAAVWLGPASD